MTFKVNTSWPYRDFSVFTATVSCCLWFSELFACFVGFICAGVKAAWSANHTICTGPERCCYCSSLPGGTAINKWHTPTDIPSSLETSIIQTEIEIPPACQVCNKIKYTAPCLHARIQKSARSFFIFNLQVFVFKKTILFFALMYGCALILYCLLYVAPWSIRNIILFPFMYSNIHLWKCQ